MRNTQEVTRAGNAKRKDLLEYLDTPDGDALVVKVAKLLVHAQREEVIPNYPALHGMGKRLERWGGSLPCLARGDSMIK